MITAVQATLAIAGAAWVGTNVGVVRARSAAFAQADDIWASDPPNVTRAALEEGTFETTTAEWNIGDASSISIANAAAPNGNTMAVTAETNWELFVFSPEINVEMRRENEDGVLWGQGFAYGTIKGIVTEEHSDRWSKDKDGSRVAEIPLRYTLSELSLPEQLDIASFDLHLSAWKMDDEQTEPESSSWDDRFLLASISLDGPSISDLRVDGSGMTKGSFLDPNQQGQDSFDVRLREPVEREIVLRVPFSDTAERVVIALRAEASGTFQLGKR